MRKRRRVTNLDGDDAAASKYGDDFVAGTEAQDDVDETKQQNDADGDVEMSTEPSLRSCNAKTVRVLCDLQSMARSTTSGLLRIRLRTKSTTRIGTARRTALVRFRSRN